MTISILNTHQTSDSSQAVVSPFTGVTISDSSGLTDTVTVTLSNAADGSLSNLDGGSYQAGVYTCTGTAAQVTADLDNLLFTPVIVADPVYSITTGFTVSVRNSSGTSFTDTGSSVIEGPAINGVDSSQTVAAGTTYNPFSTIAVLDEAPLVELLITLANPSSGSLSSLINLGSYDPTTGEYSLGWVSVDQVNQAIEELKFTPAADPSGAPVTSAFTIEVSDDAAQFNTYDTLSVTELGPAIAGTASSLPDTGRTTVDPFSSATITDALTNQSETVTVTLNPDDGTLSGGGFTQTATPGTYTVSAANTAAATTDLQSLTFTPGPGPSGQTVQTTLGIQVTDRSGFNNTATVTVSDHYPAVPVLTLAASPNAANNTTATLGTAAPGTTGDHLSVTLISDADFSSGSTLVLNSGTLLYTPGLVTAVLVGTDTINYVVTDTVTDAVTTETQTVTLSNGPVPVVTLATSPGANNSRTATLGTAVAGTGNDALAVALTSDADFTGSTLMLYHGSLVYTPGLITLAKVGTDTLTFSVTDTVTGAVTTDTQTVTLSNGPGPVVTLGASPTNDNSATAVLGTAVPGSGSDALSVSLTADADFHTGSTLVITNGNLVYTPGVVTPALVGTDTLTYTVTDTATGAATTETQTVRLSDAPALPTDIVLQNQNGQLAEWTVSGMSLGSAVDLGPDPGPAWYAMGIGAFYSGDTADIVWQSTNGAIAVWRMQGTTFVGSTILAANPGTPWHIKGTGNFFANGDTDILLQNDNGAVAIWDMQGATLAQNAIVAANPGPAWHIEGTGNFYGDGNTDILLQNDNGAVAIWDMQGSTIFQNGIVAANPGPTWHIKGTGDFYGDGNTDIVLQNDNGAVAIWDMQGSTILHNGVVAANPGPGWHVEAVGDFNNTGNPDIVLQNDNGSVAVWQMSGDDIVSNAVLANPSTSWSVLGGADNMRFIYSGSAGETLAAATAVPDEFVFTNAAAGAHTITGFNVTQDAVELSGALFGSFADVQAATVATGGGALIHLGASTSLFLAGVDPGTLHASNFALS